jgi:hypothetical protein
MKMINNYNNNLDEASLSDNPGIPGEGGKPGDYLRSVEQRVAQKNEEFVRRFGPEIPRFMSNVNELRRLQQGHERDLENLAKEVIIEHYGDILDGVNLIVRFPKQQGDIKNMAEKVPMEPPALLKPLEDDGIISEIHRRKIAKNITQGEGKNTKLILNLPEVRDRLKLIMGSENGQKYLDLLNKVTETASFFDWQIPMEVQKEMWERNKDGFSGSVDVSWETPDEDESEDLAQKILDDLMDNDDINPDDAEELFDQTSPTITALGSDFAMLLHETVKGIYQLIIAISIPDDSEAAETIISNTDTLADELEDLKYGPEIAADIRDFVNRFPESNKITNLRERVLGKMMLMEAKDFLDLIFRILQDDESAMDDVKEIISEIKQEISDYELGVSGFDKGEDDIDDDGYAIPGEDMGGEEELELDYSKLSQRELQELVDKYLDSGDFEEIEKITPWIKESRQIEHRKKINEAKDKIPMMMENPNYKK